MAGLIFLVLMQFIWSLGQAQTRVSGGGAYSYSDSTGNRVTGTYDLQPDGKVVHTAGDRVAFSDAALPGYGYDFGYGGFEYPGEDFYPTYFSNLENLLQEVFQSNIESQRLAFNAARKAFDLSSNRDGYFDNFATRLPPFNDYKRFRAGIPRPFPRFPKFEMPHFPNSAFSGAALGPGFRHQVAAINPPNPLMGNVNINRVSHYSDTPQNGYYAVASKSFASSSNINGQEFSRRGAETTVDDNGRVTSYKVES